MGKEVPKPKNWLESLNYAIEGIIYAFKTQRNMKYHFCIAVGVLLISLLLDLPAVEFVLFAITVIMLLFAEMINSAIEETVDLLEQKYNIVAKNAKDVAAGAVLITSVAVVIMGYIIFSKYLSHPLALGLRRAQEHTGHLAIVAILLVIIGVVATKAHFGKGDPLHGGMPSGHSAVAFSLWTSITFLSRDPLVVILALVMAAMVSHSRLIGEIHTRAEIVWGALLGIGITSLIFYIFAIPVK
ncbi:MAG: diacylglycerol kinase [Thermodesulfobacteriota bacterium]